MQVAILDNEDSFTYNLFELIRKCSGAKPAVLPSRTTDVIKLLPFEKIIFSPGPGLPDDYPVMKKIIKEYKDSKSILGICLGHQAICEFYGADLIRLDFPVHGQSKQITITEEKKMFKGLPTNFKVGLYHSWIARDNFDIKELEITGKLDDGKIMSVQHKTKNIFGVQFHPESFLTEFGYEIMMNFLS